MNQDAAAQQPTGTALQARRKLLLLLFVIMLALLFFSASESGSDTSPSDEGQDTSQGGLSPNAEVTNFLLQALMRQVAAEIASVSSGATYPANVSLASKFTGMWNLDGPADIRSAIPHVTPDMSIGYEMNMGARCLSPLRQGRGTARMQLLTATQLPQVPSIQRAEGLILLADGGDGDSNAEAQLELPLAGAYIADEGLLVLVGSLKSSRVKLVGNRTAELVRTLQEPDSNGSALAVGQCDTIVTLRFRPLSVAETAGRSRLLSVVDAWDTWGLLKHVFDPPAKDPGRANLSSGLYWERVLVDSPGSWADSSATDPLLGLQSRRTHEGYRKAAALHGRSLLEVRPDTDTAAGARELASMDPVQSYPNARYVVVTGRVVSPNCDFSMNVSMAAIMVDQLALTSKEISFSLMATCSAVALMTLVTYQIVQSSSQSASFRISVLTVGLQAVMDAYLTLMHMVAGMLQPAVFGSFATTSFVQLMLFSVLEMRFMLMIWKARHQNLFSSGWDAIRREVGSLYCKFYVVLLLGLLLMYFGALSGVKVVATICFSFWLPQIIHSAQHDSRPGLARAYVIGTSAVRLATPLYFLVCPSNILLALTPPETRAAALEWLQGSDLSLRHAWEVPPVHIPPVTGAPAFASEPISATFWSNVKFGIFLAGWVIIQSVVVLMQNKLGWGPRFFVPAVFLPQKYDYHRVIHLQGERVVADAEATQEWLRGREAAVDTNATQPPAPTPAGSLLQATLQDVRQGFVRRTTASIVFARWFSRGMNLWASDLYQRAGRAFGRTAQIRTGNRRYQQVTDDSGASVPRVQAPAEGEPDVETGAAGTDERSQELEDFAPRDLTEPTAIDCVICMESLTFPMRRRDYMVTPCDHVFHALCLKPWMDQKLECPTCRMQLPEP